jgi:hypothetical protein
MLAHKPRMLVRVALANKTAIDGDSGTHRTGSHSKSPHEILRRTLPLGVAASNLFLCSVTASEVLVHYCLMAMNDAT